MARYSVWTVCLTVSRTVQNQKLQISVSPGIVCCLGLMRSRENVHVVRQVPCIVDVVYEANERVHGPLQATTVLYIYFSFLFLHMRIATL